MIIIELLLCKYTMDHLNHTSQFFHYEFAKNKSFFNTTLCRTLKPTALQEPYFPRKKFIKTTLHWTQRKLMLAAIEFLTKFIKSKKNYNIIYVGAAPGYHIGMLADMFKGNNFILVDDAQFKVHKTSNIKMIKKMFTNAMAKKYSNINKVLFISDIRSGNTCSDVVSDMNTQMEWVKLLNPIACMLNFRLPWVEDNSPTRHEVTPTLHEVKDEKYTMNYLNGEIYLPVFGPQTTTESYLVCTRPYSTIAYDYKKYEYQMFYFNVMTRSQHYPHTIANAHLDCCFDCASEVHILQNYIKYYLKYSNGTDNQKISNLSNNISKHIGGFRCSLGSYWKEKYNINLADKTINGKLLPEPT